MHTNLDVKYLMIRGKSRLYLFSHQLMPFLRNQYTTREATVEQTTIKIYWRFLLTITPFLYLYSSCTTNITCKTEHSKCNEKYFARWGFNNRFCSRNIYDDRQLRVSNCLYLIRPTLGDILTPRITPINGVLLGLEKNERMNQMGS